MRITTLSLIALAAMTLPAAAQLPGAGGISQLGGLSGAANAPGGIEGQKDRQHPKSEVPPDAVPGARPRSDSVTPLKGGTNDLPPTEALFDAINRGDILTARDAINRGADLDSTNLLGLTPIELSVDLGRNDISFLLLSLRGAPGSIQAGRQPGGAAAAPPKLTAAERRAAARPVRAAAITGNTREAPSASRTPALFAGNGGAPVPSAGFLGFDRR